MNHRQNQRDQWNEKDVFAFQMLYVVIEVNVFSVL